jgi:hypothetical protein
MINEQTIKEKLDFYKCKNIELHIVKKNKEWLNCFIIAEESSGVYVIKERKFGLMHLFFGEVYSIEEMRAEQ